MFVVLIDIDAACGWHLPRIKVGCLGSIVMAKTAQQVKQKGI